MRTENRVERLRRKKEEQANMNKRERIEYEIIKTDPTKYLHKPSQDK